MTHDVTSPVAIRVVSGAIVVEGLPETRASRLYIEGILGGTREADAWRIEPRSRSIDELAVFVNRWLARRGFVVTVDDEVDSSVSRDRERILSFERTRSAAAAFKEGESAFSPEVVTETLVSAGWQLQHRTLREHQMYGVIHALTAGSAANFSVPGAGKTATTLAVAAVHAQNDTIDLVLVIGPLSSFRPWESETAICLPSWRTRRLRGRAFDRRSLIRNARDRDVLLVSYASAASDKIALQELCRRKRVMLVADESHRIKRFTGGLWAPAVAEIAKLSRVRMILSGTPMPQSGRDLYSQLSVIWPGQELTGAKAQFKSRVENDFQAVLERVLPFVSRTPKDALGLTEPRIHFHQVELGPSETEVYTLVTSHLRNAVSAAGPSEADRLAALRRGRPMRMLQAATNISLLKTGKGAANTTVATPTILARIEEFDPIEEPPAKFVKAGGIISELGASEKCVVWSNFVRNLDDFADFVRRTTDTAVFQVDGRVAASEMGIEGDREEDVDSESREAVIAGFLDFRGKAVLVTNPASCSESISLHTSCHSAIYLDRTYDCAQWLQSIDRIHRLGLPEGVIVDVHVLQGIVDGRPTVDDAVGASLSRKEAHMRQLLDGAALVPLDAWPDAHEGDAEDLRAMLQFLLGDPG